MRLPLLAASLLAASCAPVVIVGESADETEEPARVVDAGPVCAEDQWACEGCLSERSEGACLPAVADCDGSESCHAFDACHKGDALTGLACAAQHPAGAELWRGLVACVCGGCEAVCCSTCRTPWGEGG